MSAVTLTVEQFKWLQQLGLVTEGKRNSEGRIQLSEQLSGRFFDGIVVSRILLRIIENESQVNESLKGKMRSVKENSTPAIRLYNWNLIVDVLRHYKYGMDYMEKSKILNLESAPIEKLIEYLKGIYFNANQQVGSQQRRHEELGKGQASQVMGKSPLSGNGNQPALQIDIKSLPVKTPRQATNVLQYVTILLSKHFKLSPQQALNLYLDNNKYLALLMVKGIKESFEHILSLQIEILAQMEYVVLELFSVQEQKSLEFFFNCLKSCLISNNIDVASNCVTIFDRLYDTYVQNKLPVDCILQLFRTNAANTILFGTVRNDQLFRSSVVMLYKMLNLQLFEYVRPVEKSPLYQNDVQRLSFFHTFLVVAQNRLLQALSGSTCLLQWKSYLIKALRKLKSTEEVITLMSVLYEMWILFPQIYEDNKSNSLSEGFVNMLKTASISNEMMVFIHSVKTQFDLMAVLGKRKHPSAPLIYKSLVSCLQYESSEQRVTFIVDNFCEIFGEISNLPGRLLVPALVSSIQRNGSVSSLRLCGLLVSGGRVDEEEMIELVDVMMKVVFEDWSLGKVAIGSVMEALVGMETELREEFVTRNVMLCLSQFYSLAKLIKKPFNELKAILFHLSSPTAGPSSPTSQSRHYLLIQNLMHFITQSLIQHQPQLMQQLQQPIFMTYIKINVELQKPQIGQILKQLIMAKYYDIQEELKAVIDQYERRYRREYDGGKYYRQSGSMMEQSDDSVIMHDQSVMYHSQQPLQNTTLSPSKQLNPSLLKPSPFAIKDLQSLKTKLSRSKIINEQIDKKKDERQEKNNLLRSIINERRLIKYGSKNVPDMEYKCIFQFDTLKTERTINGMPIVQLTNLSKELEDIFVADVQSVIKKYRKVWRFLFFKFSTFGAKNNNSSESKIQEKINMAQVWKMHRQYGTDFIKKEECFAIVKMVNENMKRKNDLQNLTYLGFEEYVVQFCIFAYNKVGASSLSPGQKVNKFLGQLRAVTEEKGGNSQIFTNPEEVYFLQTDVIKEYNRRLAVNPNYILPEGYKKVKQTEFIYEHVLTQKSRQVLTSGKKKKALNSNYIDVLQVLDTIISQHESLGFHLLQPKTSKIERTLAKPALFQNITQKMKTYKEGYLMPKRQVNSTYITGRQTKVNVVKPEFYPVKIEFSLGIKLGLSGVSMRNKLIGEQVAYWMDDMLDAVQSGSLKVENKTKKQIQNQAIKNKRRLLLNLRHSTKQKQKQFKQRSQSVKSQFEKIQLIKQQNARKRVEEIRSRRVEEKLRQQKEMKRRLVQYQKAKRFFTEREEKDKQKQKKQEEKKKGQKEEYKKKVEEYFKLKKAQLQEKELNLKKQKQFETKKQQQTEEKKKQFTKKVYLTVLKKDQQALDRVQFYKDKYQQFSRREFVLREFQRNRKSLSLLFDLLVKYEKSKISLTDRQEIGQASFNYFALRFKVIPFILEKNILNKIFISLVKEEGGVKGIGYRMFEEALLRVIVKAKAVLNGMVEKRKGKTLSVSKVEEKSLRQSLVEGLQQNDQSELNKSMVQSTLMTGSKLSLNQNLATEYLFDPEGVTQQTIRQFMLFLDLPDDKLGVENRWREAIEGKIGAKIHLKAKETNLVE